MCSDHVPTMVLKSWGLDASLFDGELMAGPIPTIFSEDMESTLTNMKADPLKLHWDLMKVSRCFFSLEAMTLEAATGFIKKPK